MDVWLFLLAVGTLPALVGAALGYRLARRIPTTAPGGPAMWASMWFVRAWIVLMVLLCASIPVVLLVLALLLMNAGWD